jgi:hypothetical protein
MAASSRIPTPAEVREARERAGLTKAAAARKVRSTEASWEKWESLSPARNRRMLPGLYELFLLKTGQPVPAWLDG